MAHFPDLAPYDYDQSNGAGGVVHIGWLGRGFSFQMGAVAPALIEKMKVLAQNPVELYRGFHVCELCAVPEEIKQAQGDQMERHRVWWLWAEHRASNGEIRVTRAGITYAAPVLITHYIEEHGYCPPQEFLNAVEEEQNQAPEPTGSARGSS